MKKIAYPVLAALVALSACQTTKQNPALEDARSAFNAASNDPAVNTAGATELQRAREALAGAERAWESGDDAETRSRAYVARQRALIASEVGARYKAEQALQQTTTERERIRTDARTREAQLAEQRAREAAQQAAGAQQQAASAQQQAASAQAQAANAQAEADAERQRAQEQQRQLQAERERATKMEQDLAALQAKSTDRGVVVTLQDVLFDTGKAELKSGGKRSLERVAQVLDKYPERRIMVEGFTDSQGNEDFNLQLSARRAESVKRQLESLGVGDQRVETRAYGESYPVADNSTASGRQQNRRVEIVFSDGTGKFVSSR